jgi:hypothetical protein
MKQWRIVPTEPTQEMYNQACGASEDTRVWERRKEIYKAMLNASPAPHSLLTNDEIIFAFNISKSTVGFAKMIEQLILRKLT